MNHEAIESPAFPDTLPADAVLVEDTSVVRQDIEINCCGNMGGPARDFLGTIGEQTRRGAYPAF